MKKITALFTIVLVGFLFACSSLNDDRTNDNENEVASREPTGETDGNESEVTSLGTIEEATFIGMIEEINGDIREIFPLGINTIFVELVK